MKGVYKQKGIVEPLTQINYGRLTIVGEPFRIEHSTYVMANCSCGSAQKRYRLSDLKGTKQRAGTSSCGCLAKEVQSKIHKTHGLKKHPIYRVYVGVKTRCFNANNHAYPFYGGRGIILCDEWKNNFQTFYDWCIANGWKKGLTLERKDNDGNYEPSNCTFATTKTQNRNRSITKLNPLRVKHIKILYKYSKKTQKEIGWLYGVTNSMVSCIVNNKTWQ